jgi:hypothetical protein
MNAITDPGKDAMSKPEGRSMNKNGIFAVPLTVDGVDRNDPEGRVPYLLLLNGTIARVPRWENFTTVSSRSDRLIVTWEQDGISTVIFDRSYPGPITQLEFEIPLTPQRLGTDGVALLYYMVKDADENPDPATAPVKLTIDHRQIPVPSLNSVEFPHATLWGYLICSTQPALNTGVTVRVPPQNIGGSGDVCKLKWQGYRGLNGKNKGGTNIVDEAVAEIVHILSRDDLEHGFDKVVPFRPGIKPLVDNDSAEVVIEFYREGRLIAKSAAAVVKIDRKIAGEPLPCYSND